MEVTWRRVGFLSEEFRGTLFGEEDPSGQPASHGQRGLSENASKPASNLCSSSSTLGRSESNRSELGLEKTPVLENGGGEGSIGSNH